MLPKWFFLFSASFGPNISPFWEVYFLCLVGYPSPTTGADTQQRMASLMAFIPISLHTAVGPCMKIPAQAKSIFQEMTSQKTKQKEIRKGELSCPAILAQPNKMKDSFSWKASANRKQQTLFT